MMNPQWPTYMLEDCMEAIIDYRGKTPKKTTFGIPLITAKIIKKGTILPVEEYISPDDYNEWMRRGLPKQGDVVLTTEAPLGEVAQLQNSKVALAQRVVTLRGKNGFLDNTFLKYLLLDNSVQNLLKSKSTGTTVTGIKQRELRKIKLSFPPFSEQQAIAHILGTLDDKIKLNRRQNATLEAMAQATFKDWFVDFGPVRAKMEGRQLECMSREIADLFPDRLDGEGKPEGWGWKPLSCFFELLGGGTPKTSVDEYWNGEIPWFSVVDTPSGSDLFVVKTQKNITKYGFENSSVKIVPQNCTIITARGTVGKLALTGVPMTINQSCYAAKASKYIGNFFIYFLLRKSISHLESNAHGSVFSTITRSTFETIYSDYPTESLCIAFEESAFPLMEKVKKNVLEVNTLTSLRDTLLPKLISGEMRVPDAEKMVADIV
ncbi:restriction endonuclease subunit S [uncultured Bilophila sp.]|uniref:restriction endonuclease subunit S n=1 Tax=uncultured Bilophila sp. TaxID=529385 RepID=UPI0025D5A5C2|nr:restriction endonuclease subunit S [uncultured Bilophila sp.]